MASEVDMFEPNKEEILFLIENKRPVPAAMVGDLLTSLARDYRQMHRGRSLMVSRIDSGSILIHLRDAYLAIEPYLKNGVEFAKGCKAIMDFGKSLRDAVSHKKEGTGVELDAKIGPHRSIDAMVKIAAETGSELRVSQQAPDGTSLQIALTPPEAIRIRERTRRAEIRAKHSETARNIKQPLLSSESIYKFADDIGRLALPGASDPHQLINVIVQLLHRTGNSHLIDMLANELEGRGHADLAAAIRAQNHGDLRLPPQTL